MRPRSAVVVTRPGDALGFRLAGVRTEEVDPGDEESRVAALLASPDVGVLAIEDDVLGRVPEALLERASRTGLPVVFPFTLPRRLAEPGAAETYVGLLIRRAIGYHVRLK
jgi:V/A-type H+/Na+-transporting ATPase subunit F